jgi:microcystin-dependent protein
MADSNIIFRGIKNNTYEKNKEVQWKLKNMNLDVGDFKWSIRNDDYNGWLKCDGRTVLRSDYPELYSIIGSSFGSTNASNFKLPDMRGRVQGAIGFSGNVGDSTHQMGDAVGSENVTLSSSQIPSHSHSGTTESRTTGITSAGTTDNSGTGLTVDSVGDHAHTYQDAYFAENFEGGGNFGTSAGTDYDNRFLWRTAEGGYSTNPQNLNTGSSGSHSHTITDNGHTHTFTATITDPTHTHDFTTGLTGGGLSHPNVQPTLYTGNVFVYAKFLPDM